MIFENVDKISGTTKETSSTSRGGFPPASEPVFFIDSKQFFSGKILENPNTGRGVSSSFPLFIYGYMNQQTNKQTLVDKIWYKQEEAELAFSYYWLHASGRSISLFVKGQIARYHNPIFTFSESMGSRRTYPLIHKHREREYFSTNTESISRLKAIFKINFKYE